MVEIGLSIAFTYRFHKQLNNREKVIYILLLIAGLSGVRNVPLFALINIVVMTKGIIQLEKECGLNQLSKKRFGIVFNLLYLACIGLFFTKFITTMIASSYFSESSFYPSKAISFIQIQKPSGRIFSEYDWGGYLIWQLPQYKVFVDGRMPGWEFSATDGESNDAFLDYENIVAGKSDFNKVAKKYDITTILWKTDQPVHDLTSALRQKLGSFTKLFIGQPNPYDLNQSLLSNGWKVVYKDNVSIIYQKAD